jgi:large subunit ribosomal protein L13
MKTYSPKPEHIERRWYVMDAGDQVLGRVASEAAVILRGKHKPIAPHMDVGDHLIIINAAKVVLTGGKEKKKVAWRHSGHPGGITGTLYEDLLAKKPAFAVEKAVRGMLPKNRLGRAMIRKLHVVPGPEHHHQAQKPVDWQMGMRPAWEGLPTPVAAPKNGKVNGKKKASAKTAAAEGSEVAVESEPTTARKTSGRKPTSQKTAAKKPAATKTTARKPSARKTAATKKTTAQKTTTRKTTTRQETRKTAAKKPTASTTKKKET